MWLLVLSPPECPFCPKPSVTQLWLCPSAQLSSASPTHHSAKICLFTLVLACSWQPLVQFSFASLAEFEFERCCSALFRPLWLHSDPNAPAKSFNSLSHPPWVPRASQSLTVPDLREPHVTSLLQPREMEFDSVCSCLESSGGCIKKASQQCWQEYIYRDCVSFQEAAGGGAGCHRSPWLAGRLFDLPVTCTGQSRSGLVLQDGALHHGWGIDGCCIV